MLVQVGDYFINKRNGLTYQVNRVEHKNGVDLVNMTWFQDVLRYKTYKLDQVHRLFVPFDGSKEEAPPEVRLRRVKVGDGYYCKRSRRAFQVTKVRRVEGEVLVSLIPYRPCSKPKTEVRSLKQLATQYVQISLGH